MATIIGSARHDEYGKYTGGKLGDQLQKLTNGNDFTGEISMQYLDDFIGKRVWYVLRLKDNKKAYDLAQAMKTACNNANIGYDQSNRLSIMSYGVDTKNKTEADCSSLVRACIKKAVGLSVPNFTTANEVSVLLATGLFEAKIVYKTGVKIYEGDILVTQAKGHTGICIEGIKRWTAPSVFKYDGVDFAKVFDPTYYADKNPDIKAALGTNSTILFNHFILFGCNEASRWGKTISDFHVDVYASHSPDLVKAFGPLERDGKNGYKYYKHYCEFGYKENRRAI